VQAALIICPLPLLVGCGNSRTQPASSSAPAVPTGFRTLTFPGAGLRVEAPRNWSVSHGRGQLVTVMSSGLAAVALWRFRRGVPPPSTTVELQGAERELIDAARNRAPGFQLLGSSITRVDGAPAVEIDAIEQIAGRTRRVASTHIYEHRAEVVLDEYAPPELFTSLAPTVFSPLKNSLHAGRTSG
jgi:hypothetical protein